MIDKSKVIAKCHENEIMMEESIKKAKHSIPLG